MRIERAELAVYDARALDLLKRWQEHRVPCGDVDAIAGPQPHSMAALLGDEAKAIPLSLEDPLFIVEGFVDECREHRSISRIHAFLSPRHAALGTPATIAAWGSFPAGEVGWIVVSAAFPAPLLRLL